MITAAIIINICYFAIALLVLLFSFFNRVYKKGYEVVTSYSKGMIIFDVVLIIDASLTTVLGLILIMLFPKIEHFILLPIFGSFFGVIGLVLLFAILNQFEAIKDRTIYIRRFIKIKIIPIDEVYSVDNTLWKTLVFSNQYGDKLFSMDTFTFRRKEFFKLINERKNKFIYSDVLEIDSSYKDERVFNQTLVDIGKQYRKDFYKRRKRLKTFMVLESIFLLISLFITVLVLKLNTINSPIVFIFEVAFSFVLVISIFAINRRLRQMQHEISKDDEWVGGKHKYENKHVIGHHRHKAKTINVFLILLSLIMLPSAIVLPVSYNEKPYKEEEMVRIDGTIEYCGLLYNGDYVIAFEDNPIEYHISQSQLLYANLLEFRQLKAGINVYLLTDNKEPYKLNRRDTDRKQYKSLFVLRAPLSTEFVSYENYCKAIERKRVAGLTIGYGLLAIGATSLLAVPVVWFTVGSRKKGEYIKIED